MDQANTGNGYVGPTGEQGKNKADFTWMSSTSLSPSASPLPAPRRLCLDELLFDATAGVSAALSVSSAATELMPQSAATAEVQPASGSNPARLPYVPIEPVRGPHLAWLERWILFEQALAKEAQEWDWGQIEKEEKENVVNSKLETEHVTNLATLARLHGLEESNLMFWVFEYGEEEGLMRAIDELHDPLNFEPESVASEVPWKGEVLQVHLQVSPQPSQKEEFYFEVLVVVWECNGCMAVLL